MEPAEALKFVTINPAKQLAIDSRVGSLEPGKQAMFPRGRLGGPDQSYPNVVGKYLDHTYGEKEFGGTQMLMLSGVPFEKLGYPDLPPRSDAALSETLQHTLYGGLIAPIAVLGALTFVARRNVKPEDEEGEQHGK